jgi:hypothetical protein
MNVPASLLNRLYVLDGHVPRRCKVYEEFIGAWGQDSRVAFTDVPGGYVSTVFLWFDHALAINGGPPLLFETVIIGGPHDGYGKRYSTWEQAEAGHRHAVSLAGLQVIEGGKR